MDQLQTRLGYTFKNPKLLTQALTHRSVSGADNYERLEFVGDRVLGLVVSEVLYQHFPDAVEGELAKRHAALVRAETLGKIAEVWDLSDYLNLSSGEESTGGRQRLSILADAVEAILAAIYLDAKDLLPLKQLILRDWAPLLDAVEIQDAKSKLQEMLQAEAQPLPTYVVVAESGPEHDRTFTVEVQTSKGTAQGEGGTKQAAGQNAAAALLSTL